MDVSIPYALELRYVFVSGCDLVEMQFNDGRE